MRLLAGREDTVAPGVIMAAMEDADPDVRLKAASALLARGVRDPVVRHWSDQSLEMRRLSLSGDGGGSTTGNGGCAKGACR